MAFVFKNKRFEQEKQEINDQFYLGPETYAVKKSTAPFCSTVPRLRDKPKIDSQTKENDFEKYYRILDKKKELVYQKVKEAKIHRDGALSTEPRFKHDHETNLGPGSYEPYQHEVFEFDRKTEKPSIVKKSIHPKPPAIVKSSIPYKPRNPDDEIAVEDRSVLLNTGTNRRLGPGAYNPALPNEIKGVINWQKVKPKQLVTEELMSYGNKALGPGAYNPKYEPSLQYKDKPLSVFVQSTTHSKNKDNSEGEYVKNAVPGPGHYNPKISSVPIKKKKRKFELFGVSVPRFIINYNDINAVGPGSYNLSKDIINAEFFNTKTGNMNFGEYQSRFKDIQNGEVPGPGTYISKIDLLKPSHNKKSKFIDQNERFAEKKEEPLPKPHNPEFELLRIVRAKQAKVFKLKGKKKQVIPFMSNIERHNFEGPRDKLPEVGQYNPRNYELGYEVINKVHSKSKEVSFLSKTTRFQSVKNINEVDKENSFKIDNMTKSIFRDLPTYHDYPKNNLKITSTVFKSKVQRFEDDRKVNYRFYGQRPEWNIKSFNINF